MENGKAKAIIQETENKFNIQGQIKKRTRKRDILLPRQIAMYLIRVNTNDPYEKIGEMFMEDGKPKDHSTVLHACNVIRNLMATGWVYKGNPIEFYLDGIMAKVDMRVNETHFLKIYRYSYS